ncbi:MAG: molecular chaperone HtpG [Myxococcales bacterium]|nr:molecular chaperone HtpG [Myxococcales bacterium]
MRLNHGRILPCGIESCSYSSRRPRQPEGATRAKGAFLVSGQPEVHAFKSEARQLLDLMIHSLYSHKEIFLRELISNSSDALDKLRFEAIAQPELLDENRALGIRIHAETEPRRLIVEDNGIGMSRDEVISNLGTIAHSGTREFARRMAEAKTDDVGESAGMDALIGQFGVGFYSCFMAADAVTVVTRRAGEETATRWYSKGDGNFEISDAERDGPGTTITLDLREADPENGLADFTKEWSIREVVKKYSDFVTYPIELLTKRTEKPTDDEGEEIEGAEEETIVEWKTVNSQKAIWTRNPSEVTAEEYAEFYKHISHDWEAPFETISFKAEGTLNYHALVFIPGRAPFDLFYRDAKYGLQLYVNRVLIKEKADDLVPDWLRFLKGVVDSPDLSLNVSREMLQSDRRVGSIRKKIVRKVVDQLKQVQTDDRDRYKSFWEKFGRVLKEGATDFESKDRVLPLLWFQSSRDADDFTSFNEYIERMPEGQEAIYYITGESRAACERSPHLEAFKAKGYEVLYLTDPVDEILVGHVTEFEGKKLRSVGKGSVELGTEDEKKEAEEARKEKQEAHASLFELLQKTLDEHVKEVRLSNRLTESPVCLVGDEWDMSPGLERLLEQSGQKTTRQKRILEINPDHAVLGRMQALFDANPEDAKLVDYAHLLHGQALIAEGSPLPDPASFARRVTELMVR